MEKPGKRGQGVNLGASQRHIFQHGYVGATAGLVYGEKDSTSKDVSKGHL